MKFSAALALPRPATLIACLVFAVFPPVVWGQSPIILKKPRYPIGGFTTPTPQTQPDSEPTGPREAHLEVEPSSTVELGTTVEFKIVTSFPVSKRAEYRFYPGDGTVAPRKEPTMSSYQYRQLGSYSAYAEIQEGSAVRRVGPIPIQVNPPPPQPPPVVGPIDQPSVASASASASQKKQKTQEKKPLDKTRRDEVMPPSPAGPSDGSLERDAIIRLLKVLGFILAVVIALVFGARAVWNWLFPVQPPTFHPHWVTDSRSNPRSEKVNINYELHFDRNLSKARSRRSPAALGVSIRKSK